MMISKQAQNGVSGVCGHERILPSLFPLTYPVLTSLLPTHTHTHTHTYFSLAVICAAVSAVLHMENKWHSSAHYTLSPCRSVTWGEGQRWGASSSWMQGLTKFEQHLDWSPGCGQTGREALFIAHSAAMHWMSWSSLLILPFCLAIDMVSDTKSTQSRWMGDYRGEEMGRQGWNWRKQGMWGEEEELQIVVASEFWHTVRVCVSTSEMWFLSIAENLLEKCVYSIFHTEKFADGGSRWEKNSVSSLF